MKAIGSKNNESGRLIQSRRKVKLSLCNMQDIELNNPLPKQMDWTPREEAFDRTQKTTHVWYVGMLRPLVAATAAENQDCVA